MENKKIYQEAMEKWGVTSQIGILIEECAELQQASCKMIRYGYKDMDNFIEELADVEIMIEQMKVFLQDDMIKIFEKQKASKLKRLEKMLSESI